MNRLVLLGTKGGPGVRARGAMPTSTLLELDGRIIVIDCGIGVTKGLVEAGVDLKDLDLIFITHLHSDHLLELGPMIHTAWCTGLRRSITVYGPEGIAGYWAGFLASMSYDTAIRVYDEGRTPLEDMVKVITYAKGSVIAGALAVSALRVPHPPVIQSYALRFDGSKSVTMSGDTAYFPPLANFAAGSDVLLHEAMLAAGVDLIVQKTGLGERLRAHLHAAHTTADNAARIAEAGGVGRLVLNHLIPTDDPRFTPADWYAQTSAIWNGPVTLGSDGLEIPL